MIAKLPLGAVVVGVDGHLHSQYAVAWAARQASLEHRPLVIAHATGKPPALASATRAAESRQIRRIAGRRHVDRALYRALRTSPDVRAETIVRPVEAAQLLIELAGNAHLVVLGSRRLGPLSSLVLGSVSVRVSSACDVPVVVVRSRRGVTPTSRVVVGTDAGPASLAALEFGFVQASLRGAPLTVVHAVEHAAPFTLPGDERAMADLSASVAGLREKYVDVEVDLRVADGAPSAVLVEESGEADLVVVGARGHHGPAGALLGSVSQTVVERSLCPVAVVHPAVSPAA